MTLFKQMTLMLSILLLIILTTVLILSFQSANTSAQERLYDDAKNTASSLSLSLGTSGGNISIISAMINANFDSGNYKNISIIDLNNKLLYERKAEDQRIKVPEWFLKIINIKAPVASANVSAGWNPIGILNVQSDVGYVHEQLYSIFIKFVLTFGSIAFVAIFILNFTLRVLLKPLQEVQKQAEAIANNEFILQEKIPKMKEFKDLVFGMNIMVSKMKLMFEKGNKELKYYKELDYIDPQTKLRSRKYFINKLQEYFKVDATSKGGINMMICLAGVSEANMAIGHRNVDKLLIELAEIFNQNTKQFENSIVARMNGTEFSILLPNLNRKEGLALAHYISKSVRTLILNFGLDGNITYLSLGLYAYHYAQNINQFLSLSDNALTQAKFNETKIHYEPGESMLEVMGKDAWRNIINEALSLNSFTFVSWKAVNFKSKEIVHNALSLNLKNKDGKIYYYGQFMAPANQAGLSSKIYKNIINMMFKTPDISLNGSVSSLRLSYEYLNMKETYKELSALCTEYAKNLSFKLIIEIPDRLMHTNFEYMKKYQALFKKYNIEIGIYEFIGESIDFQYLQDIRPVYIKADISYILSESDQVLSALRLITDTAGIALIASGVVDMDMIEKLQKKDIYIIQGRATEIILT